MKYGVELGLGRATVDPWLSGPAEAFHLAQGAIEVRARAAGGLAHTGLVESDMLAWLRATC